MLKNRAGNSAQLPHQAERKYLQYEHHALAREVYQTIDRSGLDKLTFSFIDTVWSNLHTVVQDLDRLPEGEFQAFIEIIPSLMEARNELRQARFLFKVEEINAVYRLVMRNRAVLRGKHILHKVLGSWPYQL